MHAIPQDRTKGRPIITMNSWYSVRCIFLDSLQQDLYEERITLWRAASFEEAIRLSENEANEYAEAVDSRYLETAQAYQIDGDIGQGAEIFSLVRRSQLDPELYLSRHFNTGQELAAEWQEEDHQTPGGGT